jgi:hypothetical protein
MSPTRRDLITGVLLAPLIAGCREAFAPTTEEPVLAVNADGSYSLLITSDPHNRPPASGNRCIEVGNLMRQFPGLDTFVLGDNARDLGTAADFAYTHKVWGDLYPRIYPAMGNHDRKADPTGTPFYDYYNGVGKRFGKAGERGNGWYARDYGNWHLVVLNTEVFHDSVKKAQQLAWLQADLAANAGKHIIAMWHKPMYASPSTYIVPVPSQVRPFWRELQKVRAEAVFCGHIHRYERFAKLMADGTPNSAGIRQFMCGLGGAGSLMKPDLGIHPHSQAQMWDTWGIMKVDLHPNRYAWTMIDIAGKVRDTGSEVCRKTIV